MAVDKDIMKNIRYAIYDGEKWFALSDIVKQGVRSDNTPYYIAMARRNAGEDAVSQLPMSEMGPDLPHRHVWVIRQSALIKAFARCRSALLHNIVRDLSEQ